MAWEVEFTDEFERWWNSLGESEQEEISAKIELLQERGPVLPRPHSDVIVTSKHANMKELRGRVDEREGERQSFSLAGIKRPIRIGMTSLFPLPTSCLTIT